MFYVIIIAYAWTDMESYFFAVNIYETLVISII